MKNNNKILKKAIMYIFTQEFEKLKQSQDLDCHFVLKRLSQLNMILSEPFDFYHAALGVLTNPHSGVTLLQAGIGLPSEFEDFIQFLEENQDIYSQTALVFLAKRVDILLERERLSA